MFSILWFERAEPPTARGGQFLLCSSFFCAALVSWAFWGNGGDGLMQVGMGWWVVFEDRWAPISRASETAILSSATWGGGGVQGFNMFSTFFKIVQCFSIFSNVVLICFRYFSISLLYFSKQFSNTCFVFLNIFQYLFDVVSIFLFNIISWIFQYFSIHLKYF